MRDQFADLGQRERHVVDTSSLAVDATVHAVLASGLQALLERPSICVMMVR